MNQRQQDEIEELLESSRYVLCPPNHAAHVLRIKYLSREVETIGPDLRFPGGGGYVTCATALDGQVYCPPFSASRLLRIGHGHDVELMGSSELPFMAHQWATCLTASDGCIYALPCNAGRVLRIRSGQVELIGPDFPAAPAPEGVEKWRCCVEVAGSSVALTPISSPCHSMPCHCML